MQIAQSSIKEIITKVQSSDAWGAVSSWTKDKFKEVDSLLNGFNPAELLDVGADAFKGAMDSFGKIDRWTSEQAGILSKKAKTAWGGVKKATATELRKARGFLNGFTTQDLADVTTDIFASAVDAFDTAGDKIGAWTQEQAKTLGSQVKKTFGAVRAFTRVEVEKIGSLIGTLDISDLKELSDDALKSVKGSAIKIMGASKAASAWTASKFKQLTAESKNTFNGKDLKTLADDSIEKLKAVLSCGGVGERVCPSVVIDITIDHDLTTSAANLKAKVSDLLSTGMASAGITVRIVQESTNLMDSPNRRRRRLAEGGRRGDADVQSVVRMELPASANAQLVASAVGSAGQVDMVNVGVNTGTSTQMTGGGDGGTIAVAVILPMLAVAVALISLFVYKKKQGQTQSSTIATATPTPTAKISDSETKVATENGLEMMPAVTQDLNVINPLVLAGKASFRKGVQRTSSDKTAQGTLAGMSRKAVCVWLDVAVQGVEEYYNRAECSVGHILCVIAIYMLLTHPTHTRMHTHIRSRSLSHIYSLSVTHTHTHALGTGGNGRMSTNSKEDSDSRNERLARMSGERPKSVQL